MQQGIDQGAAIAGIVGGSRARMHHHARGLVDDGEVVVFIDDVERNFFGNSAQRSGVRRAGDVICSSPLPLRRSEAFAAVPFISTSPLAMSCCTRRG